MRDHTPEFQHLSEPVPPAEEARRLSVFGILNTALRYWRLFVIIPPLAFAIGMLVSMPRKAPEPTFSATSRFFVTSSSGGGGPSPQQPGGLVGALLGGGGQDQGSGGPEMFNAIFSATEFQRELAATRFRVKTDSQVLEGTLASLHGRAGTDSAEIEAGAALIRSNTYKPRLGSDRAGLVKLTTTARYPDLAVQLNYRILELLDKYDKRIRRDRVSVERRFIEERMLAARSDLAQAEAELARFLESNRLYAQSPQLTIQHGHLTRRVDLFQSIYVSMAQANEQQKIEEVRNTPMFLMFDKPEYSVLGSSPPAINWADGFVAALMGVAACIIIVLVAEVTKRLPASDPEEYARFRLLVMSLRDRLVPFRRRSRPGAA